MKTNRNHFSLKTCVVSASALFFTSFAAFGIPTNEIDLTNNLDTSLHTILGSYGVGGGGFVGNFVTQPAGTGVFDPFLTVNSPASDSIERGYNTNGVLYLDQQRPAWNTLLTLGQLAKVNLNGSLYYAFELDANEPGNAKSLISIDNVRIYTSSADNTASVQNNETNLGLLGNLRWAMNDPLNQGSNYNIAQWIKLDANQNQGNGGSGISDMILYVPTDAFAGAGANDYVWFYNLNGVHYKANGDLAATAGYEEWRAVVSVSSGGDGGGGGPQGQVPDGGSSLILLGSALAGLWAFRGKLGVQAA